MNAAPISFPALLAPLNEAIMPAIRLGIANPLPLSTGFVLLEVKGRKTGIIRTLPLLCTDYGAMLAVSTVRSNSQWLRNLAANPRTAVWLRGRKRTVLAMVISGGERLDQTSLPDDLPGRAAQAFSACSRSSVALLHLQPDDPQAA
jgi:deazaflavin-dependent oxidoreductase (nitroreductase family)